MGIVPQRVSVAEVDEQRAQVLRLLPERGIAGLGLLLDSFQPPLDVLVVGDEELQLERLEIAGRVGASAQPFRTASSVSTSRRPPSSWRPEPGTSTTRTAAGVIFLAETTAATWSSRGSAMAAMPTFSLPETVAYAVISAPALVSALKSVVFPAFGSPTIPA